MNRKEKLMLPKREQVTTEKNVLEVPEEIKINVKKSIHEHNRHTTNLTEFCGIYAVSPDLKEQEKKIGRI